MAADALAEQRAIFDRLRIPYELLTPAEVHHRWPQVDFDEYESVFYEPAGGVVKARESMIAVAEAFMPKSGKLRIGHALPGDGPGQPTVTVDGEPLSPGDYLSARRPWLPHECPPFPAPRPPLPQ